MTTPHPEEPVEIAPEEVLPFEDGHEDDTEESPA